MHSSDYPTPSQSPQPRKRQRHGWRLARNIVLGGLGALILLVILISVLASPKPAVTAGPATTSAPASQSAPASPVATAAPAGPQTLLSFTGHGTESTPAFTTSGDYTVSWSYSGNVDSSSGINMPDNFIATMNTTGQGQDTNFFGPNDIQASGSGNQTVSGDSGSHYLTVQANSASTWTVKVVTAP